MDRIAASASADAQRAETAAQVVAAATVVALPQLPPDLEKCLKLSMRPRKTAAKPATKEAADALVLSELKTKRSRELCAYQLLKWHEEQRAKVAAKK